MSLDLSEQEEPCRDPKKYKFIQRTVDWQLYRMKDKDELFALVDLGTNDEIRFDGESSYEMLDLLKRACDIDEFEIRTLKGI